MVASNKYTAEQFHLFRKVLHGAPIFADGSDPFLPTQLVDYLKENEVLLREDQNRTGTLVIASSIDSAEAGCGLYAGAELDIRVHSFFFFFLTFFFRPLFQSFDKKYISFPIAARVIPEGQNFGKYFGVLALVLESELHNFNFFGFENRTVLLKQQPFRNTDLGPANLYIVGSKNCCLSYMNTIEDDTMWNEGCAQLKFFIDAAKDYVTDPKSCFNAQFEEIQCPNYNVSTKTFSSWSVFLK